MIGSTAYHLEPKTSSQSFYGARNRQQRHLAVSVSVGIDVVVVVCISVSISVFEKIVVSVFNQIVASAIENVVVIVDAVWIAATLMVMVMIVLAFQSTLHKQK